YREPCWKGVQRIHCYDPEDKIGTAGQFIYDLQCILDTRKRAYDIILQLGYTSGTIWGWLLPRHKSIITTNMDGLEWSRSKYSRPVQRFLRYAEKLGVCYSDHLVADSPGIQAYLRNKYGQEATYIPYGTHVPERADEAALRPYQLLPYGYNLLIARMEPENNIVTILDGTLLQPAPMPFVVIGNMDTKYGRSLAAKYAGAGHIRFLGSLYDQDALHHLRYYSHLYFHGHSVGGTNPSLLEAMGSQALICAHDNIFNRSVLGDNGFYFSNAADVQALLAVVKREQEQQKISGNLLKVCQQYSHAAITRQYLRHFEEIMEARKQGNVSPYSR
ncbi:MAG TPA: DUF1972 domain-containing protein, partial [Chitinophaga sp.]